MRSRISYRRFFLTLFALRQPWYCRSEGSEAVFLSALTYNRAERPVGKGPSCQVRGDCMMMREAGCYRAYPSRDSTFCGSEFAWASIAVEAWERMFAFVNSVISSAMSTSLIELEAEVRFWEEVSRLSIL